MWVTGIKISNMVLVKKNGTMTVNTKDSTKMLQKRAKVNTAGLMVTVMSVNGKIICLMVKDFSFGMMTGCSSENGKTT